MALVVIFWLQSSNSRVDCHVGLIWVSDTKGTGESVPATERPLPPWSGVLPAQHGVNPMPGGLVVTASYEDVGRLAFPVPGPTGSEMRARVLLGQVPGAPSRHRKVRIEEVASIKDNRLVERRVMPADHVVVILREGHSEADLASALPPDFRVIRRLALPGRYLVGFESKDANSLPEAVVKLAVLSGVLAAGADGYLFPSALPNDPRFAEQWSLHNTGQVINGNSGTEDADINGPEAWEQGAGTGVAEVAVIDSGVDSGHEDLAGSEWTNPGESGLDGSGGDKSTNHQDDDSNGLADDVHGWDFVNDDNDPQDDFGHGTHVAGILGARVNNGKGVSGVAGRVRIVSLKVLGATGSGLWSDVADAVAWAAAKKIGIANLSLGSYGAAPLFAQSAFAAADNVLICCAAGNGSLASAGQRVGDNLDGIPFMPACLEVGHIIAIGAVGQSFALAPFSNYGGGKVDVLAPGVQILSTKAGGGYEYKSGTSMAAAFVSGTAALALEHQPGAPPVTLRKILELSVRRSPRASGQCLTEGQVDAAEVVRYARLNLDRHMLGRASAILPNGRVQMWDGVYATGTEVPGIVPGIDNAVTLEEGFEVNFATILGKDGRVWIYDRGDPGVAPLPFPTMAGGSPGYLQVDGAIGIIAATPRLLLRDDGTVWYSLRDPFSAGGRPPLTQVPGLSGAVQIAETLSGAYARTATGSVYAWWDAANNLGLGAGTADVPTPVQISPLPAIRQLSVDRETGTVLALDSSGLAYGWSSLAYPGLGLSGSPQWVRTPQRLPHFDGSLAVGSHREIARSIASDGRVWTAPASGTGVGAQLDPSIPAGSRFFDRAVLRNLVLDRKGDCFDTGYSTIRSGLPSGPEIQLGASAVEFARYADGVGSARLTNGEIQTWGSAGGLRGDGRADVVSRPVELSYFGKASTALGFVDSGLSTPFLWRSGGDTAFSYWRNAGSSGIADIIQPTLPPGMLSAAKSMDGYVRDSSGGVWFRALADPIGFSAVNLPAGIRQMAKLAEEDYAFTAADGRVWQRSSGTAAGAPSSLFDLPLEVGNVKAVCRCGAGLHYAGGHPAALILTDTGTLWQFRNLGGGTFDMLEQIEDVTGVVELASEYVLLTDGSVWKINWPQASSLWLAAARPGGIAAPFVTITTSPDLTHWLALRTDGSITAWGEGSSGQLGTGSIPVATSVGEVFGIADAIKIWAGEASSFALRADGSVWGWGRNDGRLGNYTNKEAAPVPILGSGGVSTVVQNTGTVLADWLTTYFSREELAAINISGDEADPDRDGLTNLVEYALGSDPTEPSDGDGEDSGLTCSFETVSSEALSADGNGNASGELHFTVKLKRRAKRPGIEYRVEFSDDMVNWTSSPTRLLKVLESEKTVIYRDIEPLSVTPRRWARLVIRKGN